MWGVRVRVRVRARVCVYVSGQVGYQPREKSNAKQIVFGGHGWRHAESNRAGVANLAKGQINILGLAGHMVSVTPTRHCPFSKHTVNKQMDEAAFHRVHADVEYQLDPATPSARGERRAQTPGTRALFSDAETPCCLPGRLESV